ncbi:MAG: SIS domain-containing protein [Vicinamibacterales bacterium]
MAPDLSLQPASPADLAARHLDAVAAALAALDRQQLARIAGRLCDMQRAGGCAYWLGNGGSAATATHLASDFPKLTMVPGLARRLRSVSLAANTSLLTACANDYGYGRVFVEQLDGVLEAPDVVVGVSTSGASLNVLEAVRFARRAGAWTIGITGHRRTALGEEADETVAIDSANVQVIEASTLAVGHALCLMVREMLAAESTAG